MKHSSFLAGGLALVLGASMSTAQAETAIYEGTLGRNAIVVEFSEDPGVATGPVAGRYFYRKSGIDIPLQALAADREGRVRLAEEAPCPVADCPRGVGAPVAAHWVFERPRSGAITGSWNGGKTHPIRLQRVGVGADGTAATPFDLRQISDGRVYRLLEGEIDLADFPYEAQRVDIALEEGPEQGLSHGRYRMVTDPRTKFGFPRLADDKGRFAAANAVLQRRHHAMSLAALGCASLAYAGFHDPEAWRGPGGGDLGGFEDTRVEVEFLSSRLLAWTEANSIFCGGAHPAHNFSSHMVEIQTGKVLSRADLFADWVDGPSPELVQFVLSRRNAAADAQTRDHERDCGMDELVATHLAPRFRRNTAGASVVFGLEGLPHAITACGDDLMEAPLTEVRQFLTPRARSLLALP